jgi:hypothetical protein
MILGLCVVSSMSVYSQEFRKLEDADVDRAGVKFAQEFASNYLTALKEGGSYTFADEAIDVLKKQLTEENQKASYGQIRALYGDFQSLEYAETYVRDGSGGLQVIRFKSDFSQSDGKIEVRVVLDDSGKVAGFWIKPWTDPLN